MNWTQTFFFWWNMLQTGFPKRTIFSCDKGRRLSPPRNWALAIASGPINEFSFQNHSSKMNLLILFSSWWIVWTSSLYIYMVYTNVKLSTDLSKETRPALERNFVDQSLSVILSHRKSKWDLDIFPSMIENPKQELMFCVNWILAIFFTSRQIIRGVDFEPYTPDFARLTWRSETFVKWSSNPFMCDLISIDFHENKISSTKMKCKIPRLRFTSVYAFHSLPQHLEITSSKAFPYK